MQTFFLLAFVLLAASLAGASPTAGSYNDTSITLPFQVTYGTSIPEVLSVDGGLDLPKMTPGVNESTFDWWYFDVVGQRTSFSVVFYNFGKSSLENIPYPSGPLVVQVSGNFENGTSFLRSGAITAGAYVSSTVSGINSTWQGESHSIYSFSGGPLEKPDTPFGLTIYSEDIGVFGEMSLQPRSPSRYPCDLDKPGMTEEIVPNVYWSNAVPFADESWAEFEIGGKFFDVYGFGYHDKNWGSKPLKDSVDTWYQGHGYVGNYSLVWFDALDKDGEEHFSSFITHLDGEVVCNSCMRQPVVVRPWGENSAYPPKRGLPAPSGYNVRYDLGGGKAFVANFTIDSVQLSTDTHKRVIGHVSGGFEGEVQYEGRALCEQFQF